EVVAFDREPCLRVCVPHALLVAAGIDPEPVRHPGREELAMELTILVAKSYVAAAHIEREERRSAREAAPERLDECVCARLRVRLRGAEIERTLAGRVGRMEVTAP